MAKALRPVPSQMFNRVAPTIPDIMSAIDHSGARFSHAETVTAASKQMQYDGCSRFTVYVFQNLRVRRI
jgi:hypothetical protein